MDETLVAAIERHERSAEQFGNLGEDRTKALDYYLGNPLGNEVEGRSQVVSRDVWDTIEWLKPQIAEIFCGGDEVVVFSPRNAEDVQAAEQETEFVNYIITQRNPWFNVWYDWSHDALLQKTGYVKACWDEGEDRTKEKYKDLSTDELQLLLQDKEVKLVEYEAEDSGAHTVTLEKVKYYGCVKLHNVAPENILVGGNARGISLQDPRVDFVEHREYKTLSQLRDEDFDVDDDLSDSGSGSQDWEENLRDNNNPLRNLESDESSPAMRRVRVRECWIRYDENDDGRAELLHVVLVGTTILLQEEADMIPVVAMCPTPLPHQHNGLSVADSVIDLQLIKTALLRGGLDNQYLANNGRNAVDQDNVNLDDLLVSRPGGIVRTKGNPAMSIMPLVHSTSASTTIPMLEYVDKVKAQRTGVNEQMQGLDSNSINKDTPYATTAALMSAAQQRIRFIARIFAETGVKCLFQVVHAISLHNTRQEEIIKLRNKWVPIDPRQWTKRTDMQISVGLGAGDKPQQIAFLKDTLQIQGIAMQQGLAKPEQMYNTLKRLTQAAGFKDPNEFWTDPAQSPPQQKGPPPEVLVEQARMQGQMGIEQFKAQQTEKNKQLDAQMTMGIEKLKAELKHQEMQSSLALQASNDQRDGERERLRAEYDAQIETLKIDQDKWNKQLAAEMEKYKADLQSATQLQIAEMNAKVTLTAKAADHQQADKQQEKSQEPAKMQAKGNDDLGKVLKEIANTQTELAKALSRPKTVVRGPDGKIMGVQ